MVIGYQITDFQNHRQEAIDYVKKTTSMDLADIEEALDQPGFIFTTKAFPRIEYNTVHFKLLFYKYQSNSYQNVSGQKLEVPYLIEKDESLTYATVLPSEVIRVTSVEARKQLKVFFSQKFA